MGFADRPYYGQTEQRGTGSRFRGHSATAWLLGINVIVFMLDAVLLGSSRAPQWAPNLWGNFNIEQAVYGGQVWRWVTYQFLHADLFHVFFNMMALYFFGPMLESWWGSRRFVVFYLLCGSCGALVFTALAYVPDLLNVSEQSQLIGASGSVFGILIGGAVLYPHVRVMLLIPPIPMSLRTLAIVLIVIGVVSITVGARNAGGEAAHLGGALLGFVLIRYPRLLDGFAWLKRWKGQPKRAAIERQVRREEAFEKEVDRILLKVAQEGLHSLTRREKRTLKAATERQRR